MKTRTDLEKMTILSLREECKGKIKNYGRMTKEEMINALIENPATVTSEEIFTDRHNLPINKGQRVSVRIGGNWFLGTVVRLKKIQGDDCASILLDGKDLPKLFYSTDIDIDVPGDLNKKATSVNKTEKNTIETVISEIKKEEVIASFTVRVKKYQEFLDSVDKMGYEIGQDVTFEVSKRSKINPGAILSGRIKSFVWDPQGNCAFFIIKVEGDSREFYKTPKSLFNFASTYSQSK